MVTRKTSPKAAPPAPAKKRGPRTPYAKPAAAPAPKTARENPEDKPLTDQQAAFVLHYTTGDTAGDPQRALVAAGYSPSGVTSRPYELMARPNVAKAISEAQRRIRDTAEQRSGITLAQVVAQLANLALFDPRKLLDDTGRLKPPNEWPDDVATAISGIEVTEDYIGKGPDRVLTGVTKKVKMIEKPSALNMLMKHLGGYSADNKQKGDTAAEALAELTTAIRKVQSDACRLPIAPANPGK